jgi:hypothetical protein
MGYKRKVWRRRIAERTDLSSYVVHLVRENDKLKVYDVLMAILNERTIRGSDPRKGFISGDRPAVCFQDAPLSGISQNVYYEQKYLEKNPDARLRYRAIGLMFDKRYVFSAGGRPVIYDRPEEMKKHLPADQWWRIVNYDLSDDDNLIDWTHEREWRLPGDFHFDPSEATVLVVGTRGYRLFVEAAEKSLPGGLASLKGIVVLDKILH